MEKFRIEAECKLISYWERLACDLLKQILNEAYIIQVIEWKSLCHDENGLIAQLQWRQHKLN